MSVYLFIYLPRTNLLTSQTQLPWVLWETNKQAPQEKGLSSLSHLTSVSLSADSPPAVLIIPGEEVRSLKVDLPNKSKAALSTIPFQIEERLSSKLEDLHIVNSSIVDLQVTSLVIEQATIEKCLAHIQDAGIKVRSLLADFTLLGNSEQPLSTYQSGQRILINSAQFSGVMTPTVFNKMRQTLWPDQDQSQALNGLTAKGEQTPINTEPTTTDEQHADKSLLLKLASNYIHRSNAGMINFLQGKFAQKRQQNNSLNVFKAPAIGAALLALGLLVSAIVDNQQLAKKNQQLKDEMVTLYKQLFPNDKRVTSPYQQMRGKLKNASNNSEQRFLPWLNVIAPILQQQNITLIHLKYDNSPLALRLQVEAKDYNSLENLAQQLNQQLTNTSKATLGTLQKSSNNQAVTSIVTIEAN